MEEDILGWVNTDLGFKQVEIKSVEDLLQFTRKLQDPSRFIYRGQSDSGWDLETRIERNIEDGFKKIVGIPKLEANILQTFQRRAHHYLDPSNIPKSSDIVEWFALLQHYGGATRLLDFTRSIFVAAYFAAGTHNPNDESAIWAVNWDFMSQNLRDGFYRDNADIMRRALSNLPDPDLHFSVLDIAEAALAGAISAPGVASVNPFRQNHRMLNQQGIFLIPFQVDKPFSENLTAIFHPKIDLRSEPDSLDLSANQYIDHCAVIKMVIEQKHFTQIFKDLRRMNISTEILFPDLDGQVRSLVDIVTEHALLPAQMKHPRTARKK